MRTAYSLIGCIAVVWSTCAVADTFYKWTDEQGVIHFSDVQPPKIKNVEERNLAAPVPKQPADEVPATPAGGEVAAGPARVVVVAQQTPHTGAATMHVSGAVKNVGGGDATSVSVTLSAVDVPQGNPCLTEQVEVQPSSLHPGESGKFETDLDSPCLNGDAKVTITPVWQ